MSTTDQIPPALDLREQIVRIDQMIADIQRKRQEVRYAPILVMISGMTAGAAFFAAGVAFVKVMGG
jgi:hypothetical protein